MDRFRIDWLLEQVTLMRAIWVGLAALTLILFGLLRTGWGNSNTLRKCAVLSLLCHLLMAAYFTTIPIVTSLGIGEEERIQISQLKMPSDESAEETAAREPQDPWEKFAELEEKPNHFQALDRANFPSPPDLDREKPDQKPPAASPRLPVETPEHAATAGEAPQEIDEELIESENPPVRLSQSPEAPRPERAAPPGLDAPDLRLDRRLDIDSVSMRRTISAPDPAETKLVTVPKTPLPRRSQAMGMPTPEANKLTPMSPITRPPTSPPAASDKVEVEARNPGSTKPSALDTLAAKLSSRRKPDSLVPVGQPKRSVPRPGADHESALAPEAPSSRRDQGPESIPEIYRARVSPERAKVVEEMGGSERTEAAVEAALKWLAENQEPDGRWSSAKFGGGKERKVGGHDREGAGAKSDTGVTGLALLAFLGAGQTHQDGRYRETVQKGVAFLMQSQGSDGNLAGEAKTFAYMYCHAMAAFALSECYAMTKDPALERSVRWAVHYTLTAQNRKHGSWRYKPGDKGDTSMLGWQLMVLKSAEMADIPMPKRTREAIVRYLEKISSGLHSGLASYREGLAPSRTMTAEAAVCWEFLDIKRPRLSQDETSEFVLEQLPGRGMANYYYWYYGTLAMYQKQGAAWEKWNAALSRTLVQSQEKSGKLAGSWDPDSVWGGYGGRVYSTAMGALCLEVYYRFLPLYTNISARRKATIAR